MAGWKNACRVFWIAFNADTQPSDSLPMACVVVFAWQWIISCLIDLLAPSWSLLIPALLSLLRYRYFSCSFPSLFLSTPPSFSTRPSVVSFVVVPSTPNLLLPTSSSLLSFASLSLVAWVFFLFCLLACCSLLSTPSHCPLLSSCYSFRFAPRS